MNRWIRMWNQNRKECIAGIIIVIAVLTLIQVLNAYYANQSKPSGNQPVITPINTADQVQNVEIKKETTEEVTGKGSISETVDNRNVSIMKQFIQYCNEQNAQAAYNMLTTECKNILFPTVEKFKQEYILHYFPTKRGLDYELWKTSGGSYTYKITLLNDALAEGSLNTQNSYKDYYTILPQDGYWKLNLGGLIRYMDIEHSVEAQNMLWNVQGKEIYMDYEIYTIKVSNRSGKTVMLDTLEDTNTIFATSNHGTTYSAFSHEIPRASLILKNYGSSTFRIKFNKIYNTITTNSITFSQVIQDYDAYLQNGNRDSIQVKITME